MRLEGRTAVVTGGASGIGRAIAERFAHEGATVVIADRAIDAAEEVAETVGRDAFAVELDVTSMSSIETMIHVIVSRTRAIDVLVNNAGLFEMTPLLQVQEANFDRLFDVNVKGLFFTMQRVAQHMIDARRRGVIINVASQAGRVGEAHSLVYAATKATVISITRSAALALIGNDIRVNAIAPGVVDTPMWTRVDELYARQEGWLPGEKTRRVRDSIPIGRLATPAEIAGTAVFLASSDADYLVGQTIDVNGGTVMS